MKKYLENFSLTPLLAVVFTIGLFALLVTPVTQADNTSPYNLAPQQPNFYRTDTNAFPLTLTNGQAKTFSGTNSLTIYVRQDRGLSLFAPSLVTTNTNCVPVFGFDVTYDGTNGTTTHPIQWGPLISSAATNGCWTNFSRDYLNNVRTVQCTWVSNAMPGAIPGSNSIYIPKLIYSYSGQ